MKRIIQLSLLLLALLLPATTLAHDFEVDGFFYNIINDNEVEVTYQDLDPSYHQDRYSGAMTIPSSVSYNGKTYTVTTIGNNAFKFCYRLTSIYIPNTVIAIGNNAFARCTQLSSIQVPNSVIDIGYSAFNNTAWYNSQPEGPVYIGLILYKYKGTMPEGMSITIKEGTLGIACDAFEYCTGLTTINIPNSVTTINPFAFRGCSGLTTINNSNSIISIGRCAFSGCTSLTSIDFIYSVMNIGDQAFTECSGLTSITIPSSVTSIGINPFYQCSALTTIEVANDNPKFDSRDNCNAIIETATNTLIVGCQSTVIPNSVTSIASKAFMGCTGVTSLTIPNSVKIIGDQAFLGCSGLNSIIVASDNPNYDSRNNCNAIIETATNKLITGCNNTIIPNTVTSLGANAFSNCSGLASVTIPESVTAIGGSAFGNCTGLASVTIPESVTAIGDFAFGYCDGLNDVYCRIIYPSQISMGNSVFYRDYGDYPTRRLHVVSNEWEYQNDSRWGQFFDKIVTYDFEVDGIYYSINGSEAIVTYGDNRYTGDVSIPPTVTINGTDYTVTTIGESAFKDCTGLTSVVIPNSVTTIEDETFSGCSGLTSVTIPNSVTNLGLGSFRESGLIKVVIPGSVKTIGNKAFMTCENLTNVTLSEGLTLIDEEAFCETGITEIHLPESLVRIGEQAFEHTHLTSITIPKNVAYLGNEAEFENDLYGGVFDYCQQLLEVNVDPANDTYASYNGMLLTKDLKTFLYYPGGRTGECVIPNTVTTIGGGWQVFSHCPGLTSVIIPSKVDKYVAEDEFYDCDALTLVRTFAVNPPSVGDYPFYHYSYSNITLEVPEESVEIYRIHEYWGKFQNIQPIMQASGDVDGDGEINISDVTSLIDMLLNGGDTSAGADVDGDGQVNISDVTALIDKLLSGN